MKVLPKKEKVKVVILVKIVDGICEHAYSYYGGKLICDNKNCPYYPPFEKARKLDEELLLDWAKPPSQRTKHEVKFIECEYIRHRWSH